MKKTPLRTGGPREAAFQVLKETAAGRTPEESLARHGALLAPRDLALAAALVYETLRRQGFLDWLLKSRLTAGRAFRAPDRGIGPLNDQTILSKGFV